MKIGLIIDGDALARWQAEALLRLGDCELVVYNCTNSRRRRPNLRNALYYGLNIASLRSDLTAAVPLPSALRILRKVEFECEQDGIWQHLPDTLLETIRDDRPALILKFGMGLLRVPTTSELPFPIVSYHHGDPRSFRGRPAGFYEMLHGSESVGQIVQILTNALDAGKVVAFAETKVHPHSWRATMKEAYRCSPLLLPVAVRNLLDGVALEITPTGRNYRLPGNWTVARFVFRCAKAFAQRILYGAFVEKNWKVAEADASAQGLRSLLADFPQPAEWRRFERPPGYAFLADPFYHPAGGGILVEGLRRKSGLGEILQLSGDTVRVICGGRRHYSYPASITALGQVYLLPEVADSSPPLLFRLNGTDAELAGELRLKGRPGIIDATLFAGDDGYFLFGNLLSEGASILRLWHSGAVDGDFSEHPRSPIRLSPAGSRMAGQLIHSDGGLYRVGQDFRHGYGDGIILFRIDDLSRTTYREVEIGALRFAQCRGPHTLNLRDGRVLFDYYSERFSALAWLHRLRSRLRA